MQIRNSVSLVTGGASGLGEGTVRHLVGDGGSVAILDLPASRGAEIARELGSAVAFFPADVTDDDTVGRAVDSCVDRFGRLDLCVNSAGIARPARVITRDGVLYPMEVFRRVIEVNLIGTMIVCRHAARQMGRNVAGVDDERGLIVNVASMAASEAQLGQTAYAASKGGVVALTLPLARELSSRGIRVMAISPGIMDTPMVGSMSDKEGAGLRTAPLFPTRLGTPADFARLVEAFMVNGLLNAEVVRLDAGARLAGR